MDAERPQGLDRASGYGLMVLALVQGWALYFLQLAITRHAWPATDPRWLAAFYTVAIGVPLFFYLGATRLRDWRNLPAGVLLAAALFGLGWHFGWVSGGPGGPNAFALPNFLPTYVASVGASLFVLAFLFRAWSLGGKKPLRYNRLLALSWQNALTLLWRDRMRSSRTGATTTRSCRPMPTTARKRPRTRPRKRALRLDRQAPLLR